MQKNSRLNWKRLQNKRTINKEPARREQALCLCRALLAGVVDGVIPGEDNLGDGNKGVPLLQQTLNNAGQGFGRVLGGVVEQDDGAGADLGGDPFGNVGGG